MKKKFLLAIGGIAAIAAGVAGMSAFEAHVINVTAEIENALTVDTAAIDFGTVFPQEEMEETFAIYLSESFLGQERVDTVDYILRQKPKCYSESEERYGLVSEDENGLFVCADGNDYRILPVLCPFLSKHKLTGEDGAQISAFHGPVLNWQMADTLATELTGQLSVNGNPFDQWLIDLRVPCFGGMCAQDWEEFVLRNNPQADPEAYILPAGLEHELFGCDLWIEVTGITKTAVCVPNCDDKQCGDDGCGGFCGTCAAGQFCTDLFTCALSDADADGYDSLAAGGGDCDDTNPDINPGATEICDDGIDNNCNGLIDCADSACASEPHCVYDSLALLENKNVSGDWSIIVDGTKGDLFYNESGFTFDYHFFGKGLIASKEYCLIYYADPWAGNHPGALLNMGFSDNTGNIQFANSVALNYDLPHPDDWNNPDNPNNDEPQVGGFDGAKIWLMPCANYNSSTFEAKPWAPNNTDWLFETNAVWYDYVGDNCTDNDGDGYGAGQYRGGCLYPSEDCDDTNAAINPGATEICDDGIDNNCNGLMDCADSACAADPACESSTTIYLSDLATASQYGYYHDYSGATAGFTYDTPADDKISGTFAAAGLKPYATYQLKFDGKPVCAGGTDDAGNEYLGYLGRWWNNTDGGNVNDAYYEANSVYKGGTKCISGYLVWGYVTADADGNVAAKAVTADTSYHVLWCDENSACGGANSNADLITPDAAHPTINFCAADGVYGELERFTCGGLTFAPGNYGLKMILNEESFHQGPGTWTAVMAGNILFGIN